CAQHIGACAYTRNREGSCRCDGDCTRLRERCWASNCDNGRRAGISTHAEDATNNASSPHPDHDFKRWNGTLAELPYPPEFVPLAAGYGCEVQALSLRSELNDIRLSGPESCLKRSIRANRNRLARTQNGRSAREWCAAGHCDFSLDRRLRHSGAKNHAQAFEVILQIDIQRVARVRNHRFRVLRAKLIGSAWNIHELK